MTSWTDIRPVHWLLALAVLGVWGVVLYRVTTRVAGSGEENPSPTQVQAPLPAFDAPDAPPPYRGTFRNPFDRPGASPRPQPAPTPEPDATSDATPTPRRESAPTRTASRTSPLLKGYTLIGIVDRTALVRRPDQSVRILRPGSTLDATRVTSVTSHALVVRRDAQTDTLRMPGPPRVALR